VAQGTRASPGQHAPPLEVREMIERRYLPPLPTGKPRLREYFYIAIVVILMVAVQTNDFPAAVVTEAIVAERMPPATAFESPIDLMRLTPPVPCVRPDGVYDVGQEWIRSWGDGALPPAIPACARARTL
jgi:hypothetical protein